MPGTRFWQITGCLFFLTACQATTADYKNLNTAHLQPVAARSSKNISVVDIAKLNHEPTRIGIYCSAYHPNQQLGEALKERLQALDKDGVLSEGNISGDVNIAFNDARSDFRCYMTQGTSGICQARLTVEGTINGQNFSIHEEGLSNDGGMCGGVGKSLVDAGLKAISKIEKMVTR
ncbi:MAG TPA: hypothetical protein PKX38_10080 [Alphaproteobacteria bacterium]|nr:hypothetical protein [Micavibrio sp.]MBK9561712.1 hypothetical protein [Micavibrio sp.]HQX28266.1 hypothetical protein [Alphaproteobacteria bacterium]